MCRDVAAEGIVCAGVGFHLAEVEVGGGLVELGGCVGGYGHGWEFEASCCAGLGGVRGGCLGLEW
jgi:hypothetical protein